MRWVLIALAAVVIWYAGQVLLMTFAGVLLAIFLASLTRWVRVHAGLSHGWSLAVVLMALLLLTAGGCWYAYRPLAEQATQLADVLPKAWDKVTGAINGSPLAGVFSDAAPAGSSVLRHVGSAMAALGNGIMTMIVIGFVGIYLAADPALYRGGLLRLVPGHQRPRARTVLDETGVMLERWINSRIALMLANGALTALGLWILGVPMALILGVFAGLLNFIPNFGPWMAAVPALLIGFMESVHTGIYVAILYFVLQMLDGYVFTPLVQKSAVDLPPAVTIVAQVLMGAIAGMMGVLLATPLAAAVFVMVRLTYFDDSVGQRTMASGVPVQSRQ